MAPPDSVMEEDELLRRLGEAVDRAAPRSVKEIEVGVALSIALGRRRASVSCGGCSTPLEFRGIPARTNAHLREPFHLILEPSPAR